MASTTDSVSIFTEGTFEEQIQELLTYLVRNRPDEERATFLGPFQNALKAGEGKPPLGEDEPKRKLILSKLLPDVKGLGDGTDKEAEGFFNLLFAHLFALHPAKSPEAKGYLETLLKTLSASPSDRLAVRCRILSNLFNALPRTSALRSSVYKTLLDLTASAGNLEALQLSKVEVERWLSDWDISNEEKSTFIKSIADAYKKTEQPDPSYEYFLLYVKSLPSSSEEVQKAAVDAIATALRLSDIFDFDPLFKLDAVIGAKNHELFGLLQIFLSGDFVDYKTWASSHPGSLEKYDIPSSELEHKIRLITLASLAFRHIGQNLPYAKIAEVIEVDISEVEIWAIDVIRAGLVWGKLSQTTQSLYITRATARTFEKEQWQALEKRLIAWKSGLAGILDVVAGAKRQGGGQAAAVA
ncbi:hypothetical protein CPB83DRAFT_843726 [Crepidotus variabilis]|uniref:Eukaryotic translation initiation factor 3 subunit M n=1 Tax=Crepidotus variabilis TaxID=179855 RepID=A0A9P6ET26_9AGAR|nr:hypothetical protein CPB83DRAFT_843726 [Crepidotus variabilis]